MSSTERHRAASRAWAARNPEKVRAGARRVQARQAASQVTATRSWAEWTSAELDTVLRDDITAYQMAEMLGRTYGAVRMKRSQLRRELAAQNTDAAASAA